MLERLVFPLLLALPLSAQDSVPLRLTLGEAVARAAGASPGVELAGLRTAEAAARVRQARAGLLPSLTGSAGWLNRTFNRASLGFDFPAAPGTEPPPDLVGPFDNVDARLRLTQALVDYAGWARVRAARAEVSGSEALGGVVAEAAAETAALAYLRAVRAGALVAARRADSALAAELLALARAQHEVGASPVIDVTRARTQLATAAGALVVARSRRDRARLDLLRALGLGPETALETTDSLTADLAVAPVPAGPAAALARRAELAAERARGTAARTTASAITAERLPRLELAADYGLNGRRAADALATRQIALQVSVPILDGFRREGRLAEQRALVLAAEIRERDLERAIASEVDAALLDLHAAQAQQGIAAERLRLAEEELAQARERFAAGVAGHIEVITAQVSLIAARDAEIDARFGAAAARVALARAVGTARELK